MRAGPIFVSSAVAIYYVERPIPTHPCDNMLIFQTKSQASPVVLRVSLCTSSSISKKSTHSTRSLAVGWLCFCRAVPVHSYHSFNCILSTIIMAFISNVRSVCVFSHQGVHGGYTAIAHEVERANKKGAIESSPKPSCRGKRVIRSLTPHPHPLNSIMSLCHPPHCGA